MNLVDFLKEQEGFSATWYPDGKCWAIGYGHHSCNPHNIQKITETQATKILKKDIQAAAQRASRDFWVLTGQRTTKLPAPLRDALTELCFSTGSLRGWPKFVKAVAERDYQAMRREAKRYYWVEGEKVYMKRRSEAFIRTFLGTTQQATIGVVGWPLALCWVKEKLMRREGHGQR